jgi:hypothetical protein
VELGPGLLTTIFDGIQRPLKAIALSSGDCFIPRGVDVPALDRKKQWEFNPGKVKVCYQLMDAIPHTPKGFKCPKSAYQSADMHSISRLLVVWHKAVLSIGLMQQQ